MSFFADLIRGEQAVGLEGGGGDLRDVLAIGETKLNLFERVQVSSGVDDRLEEFVRSHSKTSPLSCRNAPNAPGARSLDQVDVGDQRPI